MKFLFYIIVTAGLLVPCTSLLSQADVGMTTHWYNRDGYNPGAIARSDYLYIFTNVRRQWIGVDGSPTVVNLRASDYVHKLKSAFGVSFMVDRIGVTQVLNPMLSYAYRLSGSDRWSLSMGMAGGMYNRILDGNQFEADVVNDPSIDYSVRRIIRPDANAGMEFRNKYFIFGLSTTHLFSLKTRADSYLNTNHQYSYAIYKNNNSEDVFYKLGVLAVHRNNLTVVEGNIFVRLKHGTGLLSGPREIFDFGITYRSTRQLAFILGINTSPNMRIAYAYEQAIIQGYYGNTTHEIMVEYRILNKAALTRSTCGTNIRPKEL